VTGGARGIGRAIAERFERAGANVALVDIDGEAAGIAASSLESGDGQAAAFPGDVSNAESVNHMVGNVPRIFGRIDVRVNNAGVVGGCAPIQDQKEE